MILSNFKPLGNYHVSYSTSKVRLEIQTLKKSNFGYFNPLIVDKTKKNKILNVEAAKQSNYHFLAPD